MTVFFIAEAGINHDGDLNKAMRMIDQAVRAGADAVKFQSFNASDLVASESLTSSYIDKGSRPGESFRNLLTRLELSHSDQATLAAYCFEREIEFLSTPFSQSELEFLVGLGIRRVKIASGDLTNKPLVQAAARTGLPMIVSTGMATASEVYEVLEWVDEISGHGELIFLHCISWYPAEASDVQLNYMQTLRALTGKRVGYSDHTLGSAVTLAAVALGACCVEKHFTLDPDAFGPDHAASISSDELVTLVSAVRDVERSLGGTVRQFSNDEIFQRKVHRKSVVIKRDLPAGSELLSTDLTLKRPGTGIEPKYIEMIVGRKLKVSKAADSTLLWTELEG